MDFSKMTYREVLEEITAAHHSEKVAGRILDVLDLKILDCDEENRAWVDYYYKKQEQFLNPYNGIHGGVACVLADSCMGNSICGATQTLPSTTDMSVSYLRPMTAEEYRIHVEIRKVGKSLAAARCSIFEYGTDMLCVDAMAKFILVKKDILADEESSRKIMK